VFNDPASFDEAEAQCAAQGGHLASIHTNEENEFLFGLTDANRFPNEKSLYAWIGLTQATWPASDAWTWTDGTTFDFALWKAGQPDDYDQKEHCAQVCDCARVEFVPCFLPAPHQEPGMRAVILLTIICGAAGLGSWTKWNGNYYMVV
ncbi:lectin C-type domain protein, partial [Teladorsagia circumcincta]